jgi:peptide/nickel transport system ATP-binding protein
MMLSTGKDNVLVKVRDLRKWFSVRRGLLSTLFTGKQEHVHAVDEISFNIKEGEIVGLVGESGCGKTTTARLITRLIEPTSGKVFINDKNIFSLNTKEMRTMRRQMQMIFQDPYKSLDPKKAVFDIIGEPLAVHKVTASGVKKTEIIEEALEAVQMKPPRDFLFKYPHELSGGERQRVAIARTLVLKPKFIVADEPVSMLDASVRCEILHLMLDLTYLYITHDLAIANYLCNRIAVMYMGKIVEMAPSERIVREPLNPYTETLISAVPVPDPTDKGMKIKIKGGVGDPIHPPSGCRFHPRCPYATEICAREEPPLIEVNPNHYVACHLRI